MKIEVAITDLIALRRLVGDKHEELAQYPKPYGPDLHVLRKLYRRLTLALRQTHGHDCNPRSLRSEMSKALWTPEQNWKRRR
jgi:hypothetical protein